MTGRERAETAGLASIDICVCTYRRDSLTGTLESLARLSGLEGRALRIVVADNDETPQAQAAIVETGRRLGLNLVYLHAPARNISVARNACLDAAKAEWIAFIDDDERASADWLAQLLREAQAGWDAVLGPARAVYAATAPRWMTKGDFHSTFPVLKTQGIETGYTCNVLMRRALIERAHLRFDIQFGRTGGEDVDFFYRFRDAGGRIGFAPEAWVEDPVPESRARLRWLLARSFRAGQTHGTRLVRTRSGPANRFVQGALAAAKLAYCAAGASATALGPLRRNRFITRGALHLGVIARLAGIREVNLY